MLFPKEPELFTTLSRSLPKPEEGEQGNWNKTIVLFPSHIPSASHDMHKNHLRMGFQIATAEIHCWLGRRECWKTRFYLRLALPLGKLVYYTKFTSKCSIWLLKRCLHYSYAYYFQWPYWIAQESVYCESRFFFTIFFIGKWT